MYVNTGRFVYGELRPLPVGRLLGLGHVQLAGLQPEPEFAIEIIREYSANELIGKLHRKSTSGQWVPVDPGTLESPQWKLRFSGTSPGKWKFEMAGSGLWKVLHLRIESDETGPYVAIALRHSE
jgi:hypothetical protein